MAGAAAALRPGTRRRDAFAALEDAGSATRGRQPAGGGIGGGGGGSVRRSRSLSRFPPPSPSPEDAAATPSSRFVNKVRGGVFPPEVSLDDLADEFFRARAESEGDDDDFDEEAAARGRSRLPAPAERGGGGAGQRSSTARYARETESSRQRGRSVSRPPAERRGVAANARNGGPAAARRQRYASVDRRASMGRQRWCDSDVSVGQYSVLSTLVLLVEDVVWHLVWGWTEF